MTATSKELAEAEKEMKKYEESLKDAVETVNSEIDVKKVSNIATKDNTQFVRVNSTEVGNNTKTVVNDIAVIMKKIDIQKLLIVEIAKNINATIMNTSFILKANIMWARLIAQGNAFSKSIASAKMNSKGKWSYTKYGVSGGDARQIVDAEGSLSNFMGQASPIDINALTAELAKMVVVLTTANGNTGSSTTMSTKAAASADAFSNIDWDAFHAAFPNGTPLYNPLDTAAGGGGAISAEGQAILAAAELVKQAATPTSSYNTPGAYTISGSGQTLIAAAGANGSTQIDINIDGVFDINVLQGGLTADQIADLERQIGGALLNQVKEKLGVQA